MSGSATVSRCLPNRQLWVNNLYMELLSGLRKNRTWRFSDYKAHPRQQKFRAMNGAHLASPIRGELGYAHWPQLGSQIYCIIGNQIWGPIARKQDLCPNGCHICVQQFGQL